MTSALAKAVKAASMAREASAAARRQQMQQLRTAVEMHTAHNLHRRRQTTAALARLRRHCAALRRQVRDRLQHAASTPEPDLRIDDSLQARVLEVLERYPRGIDARQIGNELGIDWRAVMAVMSGLVTRGIVDQIEQEFYRAGKASPRC